MSNNWYYLKNGSLQQGPVSAAILKQLGYSGQLGPDDLVWQEGTQDWIPAKHVKGLLQTPLKPDGENPPAPVHFFAGVPNEPPLPVSKSTTRASQSPQAASAQQAFVETTSRKVPEAVKVGVQATRKAVAKSVEALKATFGAAFASAILDAKLAIADFVKSPHRYVIIGIVCLLCCMLVSMGLLTVVFVPVFLIGYVSQIRSIQQTGNCSYFQLIGFLRYGWDSLWHLLTLFAGTVVTIALAVTPVFVAAFCSVLLLSLVAMVILDIGNLGSSGRRGSSQDFREVQQETQDYEISDNAESNGLFNAVGKAISGLGSLIAWIIVIIVGTVLAIAVLCPCMTVLILMSLVALSLTEGEMIGDQKYNFVIIAFDRMLSVALRHWKRLFMAGLVLSLATTLLIGLTILVGGLLREMGLIATGFWVSSMLIAFFSMLLLGYSTIFAVRVALRLEHELDVV